MTRSEAHSVLVDISYRAIQDLSIFSLHPCWQRFWSVLIFLQKDFLLLSFRREAQKRFWQRAQIIVTACWWWSAQIENLFELSSYAGEANQGMSLSEILRRRNLWLIFHWIEMFKANSIGATIWSHWRQWKFNSR